MSERYYIEEISLTDEENDVATGYISSQSHGRCIRVYGGDYELTQKLIKIINALNADK